jgi:hypothetical protein
MCRVTATPGRDRAQQLAAAPDRARLDAVGKLPQAVIPGLLGIARQRLGLARPFGALVDPRAVSQRDYQRQSSVRGRLR